MRPKADEQGVILINVLLFVAIASGILLLMISAEDDALNRASLMRQAARAQAVVSGGETSAIVALRRDMVVAPDNDNAAEPWGTLSESGAPIDGGSFDLVIADAQSRFNINAVMEPDASAVAMLQRIAAAAAIPAERVPEAVTLVRLYGPITDIRPLRQAGIDAQQMAVLAQLVTALPYNAKINVNAATEAMLALLVGDPGSAHKLAEARKRRGFLTPADFHALQLTLPPEAGFTSNMFWVRTRARIGESSQQLTSLIFRKPDPAAGNQVVVIGRWPGGSPPDQAPPLPR